jgi:hypothetical protein
MDKLLPSNRAQQYYTSIMLGLHSFIDNKNKPGEGSVTIADLNNQLGDGQVSFQEAKNLAGNIKHSQKRPESIYTLNNKFNQYLHDGKFIPSNYNVRIENVMHQYFGVLNQDPDKTGTNFLVMAADNDVATEAEVKAFSLGQGINIEIKDNTLQDNTRK